MRGVLLALVLLVSALNAWAVTQALQWDYTQGTEPAVGFNVYRAATCAGPFVKLTTPPLPLTPTTYADATVQAGQTYCWQVKAVSAAGLESQPSNGLLFSVPGVPNTPSNLRAGPTTVP